MNRHRTGIVYTYKSMAAFIPMFHPAICVYRYDNALRGVRDNLDPVSEMRHMFGVRLPDWRGRWTGMVVASNPGIEWESLL